MWPAVREACRTAPPQPWSPLDVSDREDEILDLLAEYGVSNVSAGGLAATSVSLEALSALASVVEAGALGVVLTLIAGNHAVTGIASDIERAAARVSDMVGAVKGFTHMDRAVATQAVDVGAGLRDTVRMLEARAQSLGSVVTVDVENALPSVEGMVAELNQVWHHLVDNALDAVASGGGEVSVRACHREHLVVVEVMDDGPGVPDDISDRIFDAFFTTKGVGEGAGLGLEIVRGVLSRHSGDIDLESEPGRTVFRVSLPATQVPQQP
jgi:signal transduction histidine kinase